MDSTIIDSKRAGRPAVAGRRGGAESGAGIAYLRAAPQQRQPQPRMPDGSPRVAVSRQAAGVGVSAQRDSGLRHGSGVRAGTGVRTTAGWGADVRTGAGVPRRAADAAVRNAASARAGAVRTAASTRGRAVPRMPFVLLVLALLGGGLICLLVINTTLGATSFEIDKLQHSANARSLQEQQLQQQLASDSAPARIEQEACALGMRPQRRLEFLDLRHHRVLAQPPESADAAAPAWCAR